MFERFTDAARQVVRAAQNDVRTLNHDAIGTEHLLLGILNDRENDAAQMLEALGIASEGVRTAVEQIVGRGEHPSTGHIPFTPRAKKALELSLREALELGDNYIGTEHLLIGLIREGAGVAAEVLVRLGADLNSVRVAIVRSERTLGQSGPPPPNVAALKAAFFDKAYRETSTRTPSATSTSGATRPIGMFDRFTASSRRAVVLSQEEARMLDHNYIGTEHLLLGLLHEGAGVAAQALVAAGIVLEAARQQVEEILGRGTTTPSGHLPFTPRAKKVIELSLREAPLLGDFNIETEHLLLGLLREGECVGAQTIVKLGASLSHVRNQVLSVRAKGSAVS